MLQKAWRSITKGLEKYYKRLGEVLQKPWRGITEGL